MEETNGYKRETEHRLTKVEGMVDRVGDKVEEIKENHLPHIQSKVDKILWLLVTTLISLSVGLLFLIIK